MARRTMTPARRKRRAIRAAVALPILLAALVLALDFPFLTARGPWPPPRPGTASAPGRWSPGSKTAATPPTATLCGTATGMPPAGFIGGAPSGGQGS